MVAYYKQMDKVDVFTFSVETIINELEKEKGYVVFLMTASTNFGFGLGQKNCLTILQKIFPKGIYSAHAHTYTNRIISLSVIVQLFLIN